MRPTLRCLVVFLAGIPLSLAAVAVSPRLWTVWLSFVAAAALLAGLDVVLALPRRRLRVVPSVPEQLFIGERGALRVALEAKWRRAARVELLVELDDDLEPQPALPATLVPGSPDDAPAGASRSWNAPSRSMQLRANPNVATARCDVALVPRRRGEHAVRAIHARWTGPLGLVERRRAYASGVKVPVVPNIAAVRAIALRMFADRTFHAGMKVERYLGDGSEFDALREYVPGLDHRTIDWKSSARHRKLLCQELRAERNHQIVLAVDAGQLMSEPLDGVPKLDHAINASLLLGWFGLRTGDRVGLYSFDARAQAWAEPTGGMHAFGRLQAVTADIEYRRVETNYTLALAELTTRLRRRSLVVLFTDFLDTITAELMIENVTRLARRHLVLFVAIKDPSLESRSLARPRTLDALHQAVIAADFARERTIVLERLRRTGAHCIDATPAQFSMALVNRYLEIKRRELL